MQRSLHAATPANALVASTSIVLDEQLQRSKPVTCIPACHWEHRHVLLHGCRITRCKRDVRAFIDASNVFKQRCRAEQAQAVAGRAQQQLAVVLHATVVRLCHASSPWQGLVPHLKHTDT